MSRMLRGIVCDCGATFHPEQSVSRERVFLEMEDPWSTDSLRDDVYPGGLGLQCRSNYRNSGLSLSPKTTHTNLSAHCPSACRPARTTQPWFGFRNSVLRTRPTLLVDAVVIWKSGIHTWPLPRPLVRRHSDVLRTPFIAAARAVRFAASDQVLRG
jgi:hypothetical protein